ncbi:hypothetical protein A2482_00950 [Candidatus Falkowbacteria bacterium RIFOXYC2_FULL_48_21]|uniref:Uncharacterized protein n=1 Tax=Candidatus Falkowbacteria bacterium RIFOXYC2_FULL_48_21 TaxID=1798005 RepID=A0A1F5TFT3_9BACT|nr:MAG: hypothetical protein A2482_00950 [Candidatus Falkowbacteria bacterium RIFOXYC2_FULL_48_21]
MGNGNIAPFAFTNFRDQKRKFGIKSDDRRRHMYIIGKTGMGKSVLIENMVYSDIVSGNGACIVDPHGDSAELLVDCIPSNRINDVIYFNPADLENPIAFNVLEKVDSKYRHLVASGLVGVFKKIWADSWGPRLEYILRNTILALLDYPDSTLLGVNRMLVDKDYRKKVIAKVQDPVVKMFWQDEFSKYNEKFLTEAIAPIQNKIGQFLSTSLIRNIVGQVKSTINIRNIMDEGKILILNLSKGRIGEDSSALLGAMIITKIQLAAMSRVDIPEKDRRDFYLYVDEFQNFATESFANILSEARKYHLCLTIGHQYIGQLEVGGNMVVRDAIFGNVGTLIVFRVGAADAEFLVREFSPKFTEEDLVNLPKYNIYLKLMIDGVSSDPFSATTLPPISQKTNSTDTVVKCTRERYTKTRDVVEDKIIRWSGVETDASLLKLEQELLARKAQKVVDKRVDFLASLRGENHQEEEDEELKELEERKASHAAADADDDGGERRSASKYSARTSGSESAESEIVNIVTCSSCGAKTKINFNPDPTRPVYCKDCLKDQRRKQASEENLRARRGVSAPPPRTESRGSFTPRTDAPRRYEGSKPSTSRVDAPRRYEGSKPPVSRYDRPASTSTSAVRPTYPSVSKPPVSPAKAEALVKEAPPEKELSLADLAPKKIAGTNDK